MLQVCSLNNYSLEVLCGMLNENAFAQCSCGSAACQMNICYTYQLLYYAATPYLILAIRIASAYCKEPINQLYYTNIVYFSTRN